MRIKAFKIGRYGPLLNIGPVSLGSFSVFYGRNEQGKTLTIDSLVKLLFKKERGVFERIDRVDEEPDGYLIVEDKAGKETKLPEKGDLTEVADIKAGEFRNTFVIRSSDLSLSDESAFFEDITGRLTGLRTKPIRFVKEQLQKRGNLTKADSSGSLRNTKDDYHLKNRVERARTLVGYINKLTQRIEEEGLDNLEKHLFQAQENLNATSHKISALEEAQKRERYEQGVKSLGTIKSALAELDKLQMYDNGDEELWRKYNTQIEMRRQTKNNLHTELKEIEAKYECQKQDFDNKKIKFGVLEERKREIDRVIRTDIGAYNNRKIEMAAKKARNRLFIVVAATSAVLSLASLIGAIIRQTMPFYLALPVSFIVSLVFTIFILLYVNGKAGLAREFERIRLNAAKFRLDGRNIEEILAKIEDFGSDFSCKEKSLNNLERNANVLADRAEDLRKRIIPDVTQKIAEAEAKINDIRSKVGVQTLGEYQQKLRSKRECQESVNIEAGILKSHFGSKSEAIEGNMQYRQDAVNALVEFKDKATGIAYSEKVLEQLKQESKQAQENQKSYSEQLEELSKQLNQIEIEANDILRPDGDRFLCSTSLDMKILKEKLQNFAEENEQNASDAIKVMRIFEELENEEREKISYLFGEDSPISNYFNEITNGLYDRVQFIPGEGHLKVRRAGGEELDADKLSSAAYDQLYLAIRLALGEKLLQGDKGFFIMDDPFVRADTERLHRQLDILQNISSLGWQIIYFTAKDEIKQVLQNEIKSGEVRYFEIKPTVAQTQSPAVLNSPSKSEQAKSEISQTKLFSGL